MCVSHRVVGCPSATVYTLYPFRVRGYRPNNLFITQDIPPHHCLGWSSLPNQRGQERLGGSLAKQTSGTQSTAQVLHSLIKHATGLFVCISEAGFKWKCNTRRIGPPGLPGWLPDTSRKDKNYNYALVCLETEEKASKCRSVCFPITCD